MSSISQTSKHSQTNTQIWRWINPNYRNSIENSRIMHFCWWIKSFRRINGNLQFIEVSSESLLIVNDIILCVKSQSKWSVMHKTKLWFEFETIWKAFKFTLVINNKFLKFSSCYIICKSMKWTWYCLPPKQPVRYGLEILRQPRIFSNSPERTYELLLLLLTMLQSAIQNTKTYIIRYIYSFK